MTTLNSLQPRKQRIVVLEDSGERINWLQKYFGKHAHIDWCTTVDIFKEQIQEPYDLVILDHDLQLVTPDTDPTYKNGTEAAKALTKTIPVVIWSINHSGAANMHSILYKKKIPVINVPFGSDELHLINVLVNILK